MRKGVDHLADHCVLQGEDIREVAVKAFGPKTAGIGGVDELSVDPHPCGRPPHASLDEIANPQFPGDHAQIHRPTPVRETRMTGYHQQAIDLGKIGDKVFRKAFSEIRLFRIVAQGVAKGSTAIEATCGSDGSASGPPCAARTLEAGTVVSQITRNTRGPAETRVGSSSSGILGGYAPPVLPSSKEEAPRNDVGPSTPVWESATWRNIDRFRISTFPPGSGVTCGRTVRFPSSHGPYDRRLPRWRRICVCRHVHVGCSALLAICSSSAWPASNRGTSPGMDP
ncbi:hypothetical protein J2Z31_001759 [Sinorhizobium kostiense]|uniref:Uncharacterized protein n=1 Tax=Sinorhizobium kostiense TaxID=76747 RepID=A0ABS4QX96_9HYPH|nr:hypothetical protein [Sinorhizobium kostiense]